MADVIDFAKKKLENSPHWSGEAFCMSCDRKWAAVAPVGQHDLECPGCGKSTGKWRFEFHPPNGTDVWSCGCGNQYMFVLRDGVYCPSCGSGRKFETMF